MKTKKLETSETQKKTNNFNIKPDLMKKYRQETGKRPLYSGKETKGFLLWLEKQKEAISKKKSNRTRKLKEDWEVLLEKWIIEADEKEISSKVKNKLIEKIRKLRKLRDLRMNLINLLQKGILNESEKTEIKNLIKKIRGLYPLREEIFENLKAFENFYNKNIKWFEYLINAEKWDFPKHLAKKLKKVIKTEKIARIGETKWKEIHKRRDLERQEEQEYSTLELINDLMDDLQKQPELLAKLFPNRIFKYSRRDLSSLMGFSRKYIENIVFRIRQGSDYEFKTGPLSSLKEYIVNKLGAKSIGVLKIIETYEHSDMSTFEFIEQLRGELGRVTGDIKVSHKELSEIFGMNRGFISRVIASLEGSDRKYDQNYKFNLDILNDLRQNIEVDKYSFGNFLKLVDQFKLLNPDIPKYSHQQYTITNVNAFHDIQDNIEASYWFGFLCADGWVSQETHAIEFSQSTKDEESVKNFGNFIGFDENRIRPHIQFKKYKGETVRYESKVVRFEAKTMADMLKRLGLFGSKSNRKSIPHFLKQAIELAKKEVIGKAIHWSETKYGRIAHAWLLGFFDGDGTHTGGYNAAVLSSSKDLLQEIKELFESPNEVLTILEPGEEVMIFDVSTITNGFYRLTLGPEVFKRMLLSYRESMQRKRP